MMVFFRGIQTSACSQELEPMSEAWTQGQNHFQSLEAIDHLRDSLREEHGLMLQVYPTLRLCKPAWSQIASC